MAWRSGLSLLAGLALLTFADSSPAMHADTGPSTISITDVQTMDRYLDRGEPGRGAGDVEILRQALYNRRVRSTPIGHAEIMCTLLSSTSRTCTATYFLPKGKIVVGGAIDGSRLLYESAVLGGTDLYANARGLLVVTATALSPHREILVFRLTG